MKHAILRTTLKNSTIAAVLSLMVGLLLTSTVAAAGGASFSFSPTSGSHDKDTTFVITLNETSTNPVIGVQADMTYDAAKVEVTDVSVAGSPFATCPTSNSVPSNPSWGGGKISLGCVNLGGPRTGTNLIAKITLKALVGTGSTVLKIASSSGIVRPATNPGDDWDKVLTENTITLTTPSTGTNTPSTGNNTGGSGGGNANTPPNPAPTKKTTKSTGDTTTKSTTPVASSTPEVSTQSSGYYVAIVVTGPDGKAVEGANITLDGAKAVTDLSGLAGYTGITPGTHTVKVDSAMGTLTKTISVAKSDSPNSVQQFSIQLKKSSSTKLIIYIAAGVGLIIVGLGVVALLRQRAMRKLYGSYSSGSSDNHAVVSGGSGGESTPAVAATPAIVTPGQGASQVIKPTEPTEPTNK